MYAAAVCLSVFANDTANADSTDCGTAAIKVKFVVSILLTIVIATHNSFPVASTRFPFVGPGFRAFVPAPVSFAAKKFINNSTTHQ